MYGPQNKWCLVPHCTSTSASTPNKMFVRVPQEYERKKRWFAAARRDMPKSKSEFFCCEDHFKMEEDMENYIRFKLMGGKMKMKRDVVPHIFECQSDGTRTATNVPTRSLPIKRERKRLVAEAQAAEKQRIAGQLALDTPSTSAAQMQEEAQQESESMLNKQKSIFIQVWPSFCSKEQTGPEGQYKVRPFIPILPKDEVVNTTKSLTTNKPGAIVINTASINADSATTGGPDQHLQITKHQDCAPARLISVKSFAKEAHIPKVNPLANAGFVQNTFIPPPTTTSFLNVFTNPPNEMVKLSKCTATDLKRSLNTQLNTSNNPAVLVPPPKQIKLHGKQYIKFVEAEPPCQTKVPIKLVNVNQIFQPQSLQQQAAGLTTPTNNAKVSQTQKPNNQQIVFHSYAKPQLGLSNQTNSVTSGQAVVARKSDLVQQNLPEPLATILKSLPGLCNSQDIYVIQIESKTPKSVSLHQPTTSQPVYVQKHLNVPQTPQVLEIKNDRDSSASTINSNNANSKKSLYNVTISVNKNNKAVPTSTVISSIDSSIATATSANDYVVPANSSNNDDALLFVNPMALDKEKPKKFVVAHRCLELRKSGFKMDIEGFTFFDRLGFFKAEKVRAKRCANILNVHIKCREQELAKLVLKHEKFEEHVEVKPFKSRMEKLVKMCSAQQIKSPVKIEAKDTGFTQMAKNTELKKEPGDMKNTRGRKHRRFKQKIINGNTTRMIKNRKFINEKNDRIKPQKHMKNKPPKPYQNCSKYNLKNLKVVLSRKEVDQYLYQKKLQLCTAVPKRKIRLPYKTCSLTKLLNSGADNYRTFIDDTYFEIIEQLKLSENHLYYVNQHNVTTSLYMDYFPSFKKSVESGEIKVVDKRVFDKFLSAKANKNASLKMFCNANGNECGKVQRVSKRAEFCTFMNNFHSMQEIIQCKSKIIRSEHNYSITSKV